jgi:hypothetical protein
LYQDNVTTQRKEHMRQFQDAWRSIRAKEEKRLIDSDGGLFAELQTEPQCEGFFLCRSFAKFKTEFPLSQLSLADRLSLTQRGAGGVIAKLSAVGAIKKTIDSKTNRKSACYVWIANEATRTK